MSTPGSLLRMQMWPWSGTARIPDQSLAAGRTTVGLIRAEKALQTIYGHSLLRIAFFHRLLVAEHSTGLDCVR